MFRAAAGWLGLAIATAALAGCSEGSKPAAAVGAGAVTVHTQNGTVALPHAPHRIVSLSATATEDLYAVGAGAQVVAVDSFSTYPPQAPRTSLSGYRPNIEALARYRPDLVVLAEDPGGVVAQLHKLQVPVVLEPPAMSLTAVYQQISQLAQATGHAGNANAVIARIQGQIAQSVRSVPRPRKPLVVYHELEPTFFSANSRTFVGQLYTLLGLKNIADAAHGPTNYPQLSAEYVIARDPDLIVLADTVCCGQSAAKLRARPGWSNIAAVRNGNVLAVNDAIASQWGPRIVLFMQAVAAAVRKAEVSQR